MTDRIAPMVWLFQMVPESMALVAAGTVLTGVRVRARQIAFIGIVQSGVAYGIRQIPFSYGVHTILLIIVLALLIQWLCRVSFTRGMMASLIAFAILGVLESAIIGYLLPRMNTDITEILSRPALRIGVGLLSPCVMAIVVVAKLLVDGHWKRRSGRALIGRG